MTNADTSTATSAAEPSPASAAPAAGRRGLGITSLIFGLIPVVALLITVVLLVIVGANDSTGWAVLGWGILAAYIVLPLTLICGIVALATGITAIRRRRGRGAGIVGTVLGSLGLATLLVLAFNVVVAGTF